MFLRKRYNSWYQYNCNTKCLYKNIEVKNTAQWCSRVCAYRGMTLSNEMTGESSFDASFRCGSRLLRLDFHHQSFFAPIRHSKIQYILIMIQCTLFLNDIGVPLSTQTQDYSPNRRQIFHVQSKSEQDILRTIVVISVRVSVAHVQYLRHSLWWVLAMLPVQQRMKKNTISDVILMLLKQLVLPVLHGLAISSLLRQVQEEDI